MGRYRKTITEYKDIVIDEVVAGADFIRDFKASIRNFIGGRSGSYEDELIKARTQAMNEMSAIRSLDTGHNLEGWPSDALKYNPQELYSSAAERDFAAITN